MLYFHLPVPLIERRSQDEFTFNARHIYSYDMAITTQGAATMMSGHERRRKQ